MSVVKLILERLRRRITSVATSDLPSPLFSLESVLYLLSCVYGGLMLIRARLYATGLLSSQRLPCRVVSIGNITTGGTGKTPMTINVAQRIQAMGYRVVVVSRGYRGRLESDGGIVSDGQTILKGADEAGDEAYLMARLLKGVPVAVGKRRYETGMLAIRRFKPDVIVLDDAFQHLGLKRDLDIVLLDSRAPYGNGKLLPRGVLREPVSALRRADAIVFTRSGTAADAASRTDQRRFRCPVYSAVHHPVSRSIDSDSGTFIGASTDISILTGKKAVAFAGLADNSQFFDVIRQANCRLVQTLEYTDHYQYNRSDLDYIAAVAEKQAADILITTLKDFVKIEAFEKRPSRMVVIDVSIRVTGDGDRFIKTILASN